MQNLFIIMAQSILNFKLTGSDCKDLIMNAQTSIFMMKLHQNFRDQCS